MKNYLLDQIGDESSATGWPSQRERIDERRHDEVTFVLVLGLASTDLHRVVRTAHPGNLPIIRELLFPPFVLEKNWTRYNAKRNLRVYRIESFLLFFFIIIKSFAANCHEYNTVPRYIKKYPLRVRGILIHRLSKGRLREISIFKINERSHFDNLFVRNFFTSIPRLSKIKSLAKNFKDFFRRFNFRKNSDQQIWN